MPYGKRSSTTIPLHLLQHLDSLAIGEVADQQIYLTEYTRDLKPTHQLIDFFSWDGSSKTYTYKPHGEINTFANHMRRLVKLKICHKLEDV